MGNLCGGSGPSADAKKQTSPDEIAAKIREQKRKE